MSEYPLRTRPARKAPPPVRRYAAGVFANLAKKTRFVDPALAADWAAIVGTEFAALCRPGKLTGGRIGRTLELVAPNGAAAARIRFESEAIRRKVNDCLGPGTVGRIAIRQSSLAAALGPRGGEPGLDGVLERFRTSVISRRPDSE